MSKFVQILLLSLQCFQSNGDPILFGGISLKKSFDISFKPLPIQPLTFIKEKWSPFGVIKKKHTILRRDVDDMEPKDISEGSESAPVGVTIEKHSSLVVAHNIDGSPVDFVPSINEVIVTVPSAPVSEDTEPVTVAPLYVQPVAPQSLPPQDPLPPVSVPIVEQAIDPPSPPALVIVPPEEVAPPIQEIVSPTVSVPPAITVLIPPQQPIPIIEEPVSPVVAPPLSVPIIVPPGAAPGLPPQIVPLVLDKPSIPGSVLLPPGSLVPVFNTGTIEDYSTVAPPPPIRTVPIEYRPSGFLNNIYRVAPGLLNTPFGKRISPIESNSIDGLVNQNESSFIRGSKKALHLGNVVLQVMSQLFSNARLTLDRLTSPPPIYLN